MTSTSAPMTASSTTTSGLRPPISGVVAGAGTANVGTEVAMGAAVGAGVDELLAAAGGVETSGGMPPSAAGDGASVAAAGPSVGSAVWPAVGLGVGFGVVLGVGLGVAFGVAVGAGMGSKRGLMVVSPVSVITQVAPWPPHGPPPQPLNRQPGAGSAANS